MTLAARAAHARAQVAEALERLEVPPELARDVARRLPWKVAERFLEDLRRLWRGGPTPMTPR